VSVCSRRELLSIGSAFDWLHFSLDLYVKDWYCLLAGRTAWRRLQQLGFISILS
jgi:hypothetical protein